MARAPWGAKRASKIRSLSRAETAAVKKAKLKSILSGLATLPRFGRNTHGHLYKLANSFVVRPSPQLLSRMHLYLTYFQVVWTSLFRNSRNFCHFRHQAELFLHFHRKGSAEITGSANCFYSYLIFTASHTLISFFFSSFFTHTILRVIFREMRFDLK